MSDKIFTVDVDFKGIERLFAKANDDRLWKNVDRHFANEVMRYADDYAPFETGVMKNSAEVAPDGSYIEYTAPYARYVWYGKLMVDPITGKGAFFNPVTRRFWSRKGVQKVLTDKDLHFKGAPIRGSKWVERMWQYHSSEIIESVSKYIDKELRK